MQFKVPEALHSALTQYDSVLKQQAKLKETTSSTKKTAKPKYPHGNVNFLVPADVLSPEELQITIDRTLYEESFKQALELQASMVS